MGRDPTIEFYHRESETQRAEIAGLRARIENLQNDLTDQTERGDQATTDVHRLRAELAASNNERGLLRVEAAGHDREIEERGVELDRLNAATTSQDAEIASFHAELTSQRDKYEAGAIHDGQVIETPRTELDEVRAEGRQEIANVVANYRAAARQDAEKLDRYRYAVAFAAADSWDGGPDMRYRLEWARANDPGGHLTNGRVAEIGGTFPAEYRGQLIGQDAEEIARLTSTNSDLAMMLRRMIWMVGKETGDTSMKVLAGNARELLDKHSLGGNALRNVSSEEARAALACTQPARNRPLPETRCDCCDNGLDDAWEFCPSCGQRHPDATDALACCPQKSNEQLAEQFWRAWRKYNKLSPPWSTVHPNAKAGVMAGIDAVLKALVCRPQGGEGGEE